MKKILLVGLLSVTLGKSAYSQQTIWGAGSTNTTIDSIGRFAFDFETANGWSNQSVSNGSGPTSTPMWVRSLTAVSQGAYFGTQPAMTSPSMNDGVALFDSDFLDNGGTAGAFGMGISPSPQFGRLISPTIDLTGQTGNNLAIEMYLYYRNFQITDISVGFSNDGGSNWTDISINQGVPANTVFPTALISVPIPSALLSVANLSNCKLRLNFNGDYYYLMIDDIRIVSVCSTVTNSITVSECESYTSPAGNIHTFSEVFTDTLTAVSGCDSLITVDLTIDNLNASVSVNQFQLTADSTGLTYQWINCATNSAIPGATSQSFTPTIDGDYAVVISNGNCSDSSVCTTIAGLGLTNLSLKKNVELYPNPSNGWLEIKSDQLIGKVSIYNQLGAIVLVNQIADFTKNLNIESLENGFYYIEFETENSIEKQSFILKR